MPKEKKTKQLLKTSEKKPNGETSLAYILDMQHCTALDTGERRSAHMASDVREVERQRRRVSLAGGADAVIGEATEYASARMPGLPRAGGRATGEFPDGRKYALR